MTNTTFTTNSGDTTTSSYNFTSDKPLELYQPVNEYQFVGELECKHANIKVLVYKKLNWFQRLCYNILGFEYKQL
jgi:hypothetical protein